MHQPESAIVLFTLSPEDEGRRRRWGSSSSVAALYAALIDQAQCLGSALGHVDLIVASPRARPGDRGRHLAQRGSGFGENLRNAIADTFALGYRRVVVIGNDAPGLTEGHLRRAFRSLLGAGKRASLCPTSDGGYALLGLNAPCPTAFEFIPWGSSRVDHETRRRLSQAGFTIGEQQTLDDIDSAEDLARFLAQPIEAELRPLVRRLRRLAAGTHCSDRALAIVRWVGPWARPTLRGPPPSLAG